MSGCLDEVEADFVEVDPTGRYGRYDEVLGKGAFKTVYKAFDEKDGIEVAWNQVKLQDALKSPDDLGRLYSEVHLLKSLQHKNIIKFHYSWVDTTKNNINFITEIFTSGNLRQYRNKHRRVDMKAVKHWARQILRGLLYLHSQCPPIIHRDLKCDNIFVNGNQGEVKIGDLGLAAILRAHAAHSVIGTPEFMAPELYEESYNELVDIYAFGMCLLEMVTFEYPYSECMNAAQIYKKVTAGKKPAALDKVKDPEMRAFVEQCLAKASSRLPARELLMDPFLQCDSDSEFTTPPVGNSDMEFLKTLDENFNFDLQRHRPAVPTKVLKCPDCNQRNKDFKVKVRRRNNDTILLRLRIADHEGDIRNIQFPFDVEADTALSVASEMVAELDLSDQDVTTIADMIDAEIMVLVPHWKPGALFDDNAEKRRDEDDEDMGSSGSSSSQLDCFSRDCSATEGTMHGRFEEFTYHSKPNHLLVSNSGDSTNPLEWQLMLLQHQQEQERLELQSRHEEALLKLRERYLQKTSPQDYVHNDRPSLEELAGWQVLSEQKHEQLKAQDDITIYSGWQQHGTGGSLCYESGGGSWVLRRAHSALELEQLSQNGYSSGEMCRPLERQLTAADYSNTVR